MVRPGVGPEPDPPRRREGRERTRPPRHVGQRVGVGERRVERQLLRVEPVRPARAGDRGRPRDSRRRVPTARRRLDRALPPAVARFRRARPTTSPGSASRVSDAHAPTLSSVTPNAGSMAGGTAITLTGTNFAGAGSRPHRRHACDECDGRERDHHHGRDALAAEGRRECRRDDGWRRGKIAGGFVAIPAWATVIESAPNPTVVTDATLAQRDHRHRPSVARARQGHADRDAARPAGKLQHGVLGVERDRVRARREPGPPRDVSERVLHRPLRGDAGAVDRRGWARTRRFFTSASAQVPAAQVPNRPVEHVSWNTVQGSSPTAAFGCRQRPSGSTPAGRERPPRIPTGRTTRAGDVAWLDERELSQPNPSRRRKGRKRIRPPRHRRQCRRVGERLVFGDLLRDEPVVESDGAVAGAGRVSRGGTVNDLTGPGAQRSSARLAWGLLRHRVLGFRVARSVLDTRRRSHPCRPPWAPSRVAPISRSAVTILWREQRDDR